MGLQTYYFVEFFLWHRRFPLRPENRFADFLYKIKAGNEILNPLRQKITDKFEVKAYICDRLGRSATVPTLAVLTNANDLATFEPSIFAVVAKPTHSSGRIAFIGSLSEWRDAQTEMQKWLSHDYFRDTLERNYEGLIKRVIVECLIDTKYRFEGSVHCRQGVAKAVSIIDRHSKERQTYTPKRQPLGISLGFPLRSFELADWAFFDPVLEAAAVLAHGLNYVRVDFYTDGQNLLFGELTNLPSGANLIFYPVNGESVFSAAFFA